MVQIGERSSSDYQWTNATGYQPLWEDPAPARNDRTPPGKFTHYELITKGILINATIHYSVRNAQGAEVGRFVTDTIVDGRAWWSTSYGAASHECRMDVGPFECYVTGRDTIAVRDRRFFSVTNNTSKLTFRLEEAKSETSFRDGQFNRGVLVSQNQTVTGAVAPTGRTTKTFLTYAALNAQGARKQAGSG